MATRIDEEVTFRKLEILLTYIDAGSLGRAAEVLGISSVSVHRALHSLEAGVRCTLFRAEGRSLLPNDAAQALADVSRDVLRMMAEGIRSTREVAGHAADRIRIGSLYSLTSGTVPALIMGLKLRKPDVHAELVLGSNADLLLKLRDGAIDAALMGRPSGAADIESQRLFDDDIFFAARVGSRYGDHPAVDLACCADESFVSLTEGFATYSLFVDAFRVAGFTPNVVMTTGDIFSLMNLVSGGIGRTCSPRSRCAATTAQRSGWAPATSLSSSANKLLVLDESPRLATSAKKSTFRSGSGRAADDWLLPLKFGGCVTATGKTGRPSPPGPKAEADAGTFGLHVANGDAKKLYHWPGDKSSDCCAWKSVHHDRDVAGEWFMT